MTEKISLKEAEIKVFKAAYNDGLWDVFIGSFFLQFAIAPLLSDSLGDFWSSAVFLPFWALVITAIILVRKHVVTPRTGIVKFGASRKKRLTKFTTAMLAVNIAAFIAGLFFAFNFNIAPGWIITAAFGFMILLMSSAAAYFLNFNRLFIYGLLFFLSSITGEWLYINLKINHHGFPITFGITAGIIIITGLVLFFRLIKEYPIPVNESIPEEETG